MPTSKPPAINAFTIGTIVVIGILALAVSLIDTGGSLLSSSDRD